MKNNYYNRKEQIVHTALHIISEKGMKKLTMKNIASEIGFTDAALYRHFSSKRDILKELIEVASTNLINKVNTVVAKTDDPVDKLHEILRIHLAHMEQHKGMSRIIFSEEVHQNDAELRGLLFRTINHYLDLVRGILLRAKVSGAVRADIDIDATAVAFFGLIQSVTFLWSLSDYAYSIHQKADDLFVVFSRGLH